MAKASNPNPGAPAPKAKKAAAPKTSAAPKESVADRQARHAEELEKSQSTAADQPGGAKGAQSGEQDPAVANAADAAAAAMAGLEIARRDGSGDGYQPRVREPDGIELETISVHIERDAMQKIPRTIFAFELPILMGVHGQDKVHVLEGSQDFQTVDDFDVEETYDQLLRRYDRAGNDPVRKVYPRVQDLATELGIKLRKAKTRGAGYRPVANSSQQKDHARDARAAGE